MRIHTTIGLCCLLVFGCSDKHEHTGEEPPPLKAYFTHPDLSSGLKDASFGLIIGRHGPKTRLEYDDIIIKTLEVSLEDGSELTPKVEREDSLINSDPSRFRAYRVHLDGLDGLWGVVSVELSDAITSEPGVVSSRVATASRPILRSASLCETSEVAFVRLGFSEPVTLNKSSLLVSVGSSACTLSSPPGGVEIIVDDAAFDCPKGLSGELSISVADGASSKDGVSLQVQPNAPEFVMEMSEFDAVACSTVEVGWLSSLAKP